MIKKLKTATPTVEPDPDLIDLTMIPPPMTPDEEGVYRVFPGAASAVSTPPTPFADRQSLEAELKALENDFGNLNQLSHADLMQGASAEGLVDGLDGERAS